MFEHPHTIPLLLLISLITFSDIRFNDIDDNASSCFRPVLIVAGPDVSDA